MNDETELEKYLEKYTPFTNFPTLDGIKFLLKAKNNPEQKIKFIHIAGTNGKGSIVEMLNKVLIDSNYKIGKYITPHLINSNESIQINNTPIPDEEFLPYIDFLEKQSKLFLKKYNRELTRFEIQTFICIDYFYNQKVDIAILEVGLGGRYDCTNVVNPIVSGFGSINYDHMNILGNTLKEITLEKAGIIKENSNSVIFNQEAVKYIKPIAKERNNKLTIIDEDEISDYSFDKDYQYFRFKNKDYKINLKGKKQIENACVVLNIIEILKSNNYKIDYDTIYDSLAKIIHPGRYETILKKPLTIYDGAHNEDAIKNFIEITKLLYKDYNKTFIISIINTKDYKTILDNLYKAFPNEEFIFTSGNNPNKYINSKILFEYESNLIKNNDSNSKINKKTIDISDIKNNLRNQNINFIIGSFYIYKTIRELLK